MDNQSTLPPNVTMALQDDLLTVGSWRVVQNRYCMTPGLSTFFGVTTKVWQVPYTGHSKLFKVIQGLDGVDNRNISNCGLPQTADCIQFVQPFVLDAIRSRTPTSAGVRAIQPVAKELQRYNTLEEVQYYRNTALESFAVSGASLQWINQLMAEHVIDVASDNVRGQCTPGHSCDERACKETILVTSICHSPVSRHLVPARTSLSSRKMRMPSLSSSALQPLVHNCGMESSDLVVSAGTMCTSCAARGKSGRSRYAVWLDTIWVPLGFVMAIGRVATRLCVTGREVVQKCAVQPESAMTIGRMGE
jgi:hypothetical protein